MNRINERGQTLLEVILAISIMSFGIIGIVTLSITTTIMARRTSKQLVATQLAREAMEVVHNIRDSNWLDIEAGFTSVDWNTGLYYLNGSAYDYTALPVFNPQAAQPWTLEFPNVNSISATRAQVCIDTSNNYYRQLGTSTSCPNGSTATIYKRMLTLYPICVKSASYLINPADAAYYNSESSPAGCSGQYDYQIGIRVQSEVQWLDNGITYSKKIEERMYDWKAR